MFKMLKKSLILSAILAASLNAGMFGDVAGAAMGGGKASSSVSASDIDAVLGKAKQAEQLLLASIGNISSAILSKEDVAKYETALAEANKISDPKERQAAINKIIDAQDTLIAKAADDKSVQEGLKKASADKKEALANAGFNFLLAGKKDGEALLGVNSTISSLTSNPSAAMHFGPQLASLKDLAVSLPTQGSSVVQIGGKLYDLMKAGGIQGTLPQSGNDAPKPMGKLAKK
jgi:hypothetical protein